jgi:uncharacterized membrane-anchored protein YhcB (DUF1043 family)
MNQPMLLVAGGALLLILGAALGYLVAAIRHSKTQARTDAVKAEYDAYRENVTGHFRETAVRFEALGEQYKSLYRHMADGAQNLCEKPASAEGLGFSPFPELEQAAEQSPEAAPLAADSDDADIVPRDYVEPRDRPGADEPRPITGNEETAEPSNELLSDAEKEEKTAAATSTPVAASEGASPSRDRTVH